jgi:hypothetical protein
LAEGSKSVLSANTDNKSGVTTQLLSHRETPLPDWLRLSGSSVAGEEVDAIISSPGIIPSSTTTALITLNDLDISNIFALPTTQWNAQGWLDQSPLMSSWSFPTTDPLGQQLVPKGPKAFWPRGLKWRQLSLVRKSVLSTLRKFPKMMLSDSDMPPFISHMWMAEEKRFAESSQPGPLSRCAGIMALWSTKNRNNKHYIWKIVRLEQERLSEESVSNNDWNAVTALQAITIYFLLRISAGDDEETDFDVPLIQTMTKLLQRVKGFTVKYCDPASTAYPTWEGWTLVESVRRTISTFFIIDFLFDITPGIGKAGCNTAKNWSEMLLPSAKQLWAAKTRLKWEQDYRSLDNDRRPTFGELLKHDSIDSKCETLLEQWIGQVDEFGSLVINAASLAEVIA